MCASCAHTRQAVRGVAVPDRPAVQLHSAAPIPLQRVPMHMASQSVHTSLPLLAHVSARRPTQVVPTVGVDGEDGDKAREKMQKHFRLLGARVSPALEFVYCP